MYHLPNNVTTIDGAPLSKRLEGEYWREVITHLEKKMGDDFSKYKFRILSLKTHQKPDVEHYADPMTILIVLGDNSGEHYTEMFSGFRVVFKVHLPDAYENIYPVPLGYTNMQLFGSSESVINRTINVFYSGNINAHRVDLWRALSFKNPWPRRNIRSRLIRRGIVWVIRRLNLCNSFIFPFPDSIIRFTPGFAKGMDAEDYSCHLIESKISISPFGFGRAECFRHFESMRAGCIVITDRLPDTWYFKDSPIIQINHWTSLKSLVGSLLANPQQMEEIQQKTIKWWEQFCSPSAVAAYMADVISTSLTPEERIAKRPEKTITPRKHTPYC